MILADETEPEKAPEEKTKENKAEKHKESADEGKGEKKKHPPLWKQLRFAVHNGLAENIFKALAAVLAHSMPRKWDFCGEFGTGDPMQTGLLAGMAKAFLPEAAKNVVWKYIEPSYKLKGKGQGRIIPFYAVYIVLRLAASAPARQFWRYRREESTMNDDARKKIFEEFKEMIRTETVVGQPIYLDDATIVPFVDISFGFGTGNHGTNGESSGEAGGGKMSPTAVLIMKGERVELFSIKNATPNGTIDRVLNMIPEAVSHFTKKKEKKNEVREAALKEAKEAMKEEAETAALEAKV